MFRSEYCLKEMISRQEALFGIEKIAYAKMVDTAQHLHLMKKLVKGARERGIGCDFFKIFTKCRPENLENFLGEMGSLQGKLSRRE